jgi:hypothetical protein
VIGGIVGAVFGVAFITAILYFIYKKYQKRKNKQYLIHIYSSESQSNLTSESTRSIKGKKENQEKKKEIASGNSTEMDHFEVERRHGMEVNSAAGRFEVQF